MIRHFTAVLAACLLLHCAHVDAPAGQVLLPHHGGRIIDAGLGDPDAVGGVCAPCTPLTWTGASLDACFVGTGLQVQLRCAEPDGARCHDNLRVTVDGTDGPQLTPVNGTDGWYTAAAQLPRQPHRLRLRRTKEAQVGPLCLCAVRASGGHMLPPPPAPARNLLIFGDSISAGYGNLCADVKTGDPLGNQDGTQTYGALAAARLGAQVRIVAWSGIGVWRNGDGSTDNTLPKRWAAFLNAQRPAARALSAVPDGPPDAIVINLGSNDLRQAAVDKEALVATYTSWVRQLHQRYPAAHVFLALGPMLTDKAPKTDRRSRAGGGREDMLACLRSVLANLQLPADAAATQTAAVDEAAAADAPFWRTHAHLLLFATQDGSLGYGCDYHPNTKTHGQMADTLVEALQRTLSWSPF